MKLPGTPKEFFFKRAVGKMAGVLEDGNISGAPNEVPCMRVLLQRGPFNNAREVKC